MKICVTSRGPFLESAVDPRFGLCPYFILVDPETMTFQAMENPHLEAGGDTSRQTASFLAHTGVEALITGPISSPTYESLRAARIRIYIGPPGKVQEAVEKYIQR
jgi:predicted Fe-Mo cluster-binding NifX family protein